MMEVNQYLANPEKPPSSGGVPAGNAGAAPIRLVLLSANEDNTLMRRLAGHMRFVQDDGVELWSSQALLPGSDESNEIHRAVAGADVIVVGLSIHFVVSEMFPRISAAIGSRRRRGAEVIPLLLGPVDWQASVFGDLRPLPANRTPIALWRNQDAGLVEVVMGIREVIAAQKHRPGPPATCRCARAGVRAARQVLTWKVGTAAFALISMGAIVYHLTGPSLPPGKVQTAGDCLCGAVGTLPVPAERIGKSPPSTPTPEDADHLVFERVPIEAPMPIIVPGSMPPDEPPVQIAEPSPSTPPQAEATSSVKVPMSPGQVFAVMYGAKRAARNGCREELARSGNVLVSVQFNDEGRSEKVDVHSSELLDEATRDCIRSVFLGARVSAGNGGYRVDNWTVQ